jgi:hypothetical protein
VPAPSGGDVGAAVQLMRRPGEHRKWESHRSTPASTSPPSTIKSLYPGMDDPTIWARLGATPIWGINDTPNNTFFELTDEEILVDFGNKNKMGCMSGWDLTRDFNQHDQSLCPIPPPSSPVRYKCTYHCDKSSSGEYQPWSYATRLMKFNPTSNK